MCPASGPAHVTHDEPTKKPAAAAPVIVPRTSQDLTLSIWIVRGLVEAVERSGVGRAQLMQAAGLPLALLDSVDARVTLSDLSVLCELALDLTGDPALALHWASLISEGTFVPISPLIAHAQTLRQAFEMLTRFSSLLSDHPGYELSERGDSVVLQTVSVGDESPRMQRFAAELTTGGFYRTLRYFKIDAREPSVHFAYPAPSYHEEYATVFGSAHKFDQPFSGIVFDRALLDSSPPHKDEEVHDALQVLAERRMQRMTQRVPYAQRVRELLQKRSQPQRTDMESVARELGLSVRSLRRCLETERTSYNAVVDETLAGMAKHLLHDQRRTIQETAFEMGFSDASTFHRAFKSWTGMTPRAFRKSQR